MANERPASQKKNCQRHLSFLILSMHSSHRTSIRPSWAITSLTTLSTKSSEHTSNCLIIRVSPRHFLPSSSSWPFFGQISHCHNEILKRFSVSLVRNKAVASPMPLEQPEISTIFGAIFYATLNYSGCVTQRLTAVYVQKPTSFNNQ